MWAPAPRMYGDLLVLTNHVRVVDKAVTIYSPGLLAATLPQRGGPERLGPSCVAVIGSSEIFQLCVSSLNAFCCPNPGSSYREAQRSQKLVSGTLLSPRVMCMARACLNRPTRVCITGARDMCMARACLSHPTRECITGARDMCMARACLNRPTRACITRARTGAGYSVVTLMWANPPCTRPAVPCGWRSSCSLDRHLPLPPPRRSSGVCCRIDQRVFNFKQDLNKRARNNIDYDVREAGLTGLIGGWGVGLGVRGNPALCDRPRIGGL